MNSALVTTRAQARRLQERDGQLAPAFTSMRGMYLAMKRELEEALWARGPRGTRLGRIRTKVGRGESCSSTRVEERVVYFQEHLRNPDALLPDIPAMRHDVLEAPDALDTPGASAYRLGRVLGFGSTATVREATDAAGRQVWGGVDPATRAEHGSRDARRGS